MSLKDFFRVKEIQKENFHLTTENRQLSSDLEQLRKSSARLSSDLDSLRASLTPEITDALARETHLNELEIKEKGLNDSIQKAMDTLRDLNEKINTKKKNLVDLDDAILYQDFGLYTPRYDFMNSEEYASRLAGIRNSQKNMIKNNLAVTGYTNWTVNGSKTEGSKMVRDTQKLLLRAFNSECDYIIEHVTYANIETSEKRINTSCDNISKLGRAMGISITCEYQNAKNDELYLAFEYKRKKQEEKEDQKELRAQMREEAKLQKELEEARRKALKEQQHYQNALDTITQQLITATDVQKILLEQKRAEIEMHLADIDSSLADIDYRAANPKVGYVYVISNIGSFGENVYKIGMTRRQDPQERIDELGDASVPFNFDVHAMIFTDDAPGLEAALHRAFENRKLNMVNQRREFFNVTLQEIKEEIYKNFDRTVEFVELPPAEQYRTSLKMRAASK